MTVEDDFALPTHVLSEEEAAELSKTGVDEGDYEAMEKTVEEELAPVDETAPCEDPEEPIKADEDDFAVPATEGEEGPGQAEEDGEFALPDLRPGEDDPTRRLDEDGGAAYEPYESRIPSRIITAELQKAMLRARLILHNTFERVDTNEGAMLHRLMEKQPDVYADLILRLAITHFITWQKAMGL